MKRATYLGAESWQRVSVELSRFTFVCQRRQKKPVDSV